MTKPTLRLVWQEKTQISLHICTVWSLIAYAFLLPPGYPKRDKWELLPCWVNTHADLCRSHRSSCRFCCALDHIIFYLYFSHLHLFFCVWSSTENTKSKDFNTKRKNFISCNTNHVQIKKACRKRSTCKLPVYHLKDNFTCSGEPIDLYKQAHGNRGFFIQ